jgi:hypothetical protein
MAQGEEAPAAKKFQQRLVTRNTRRIISNSMEGKLAPMITNYRETHAKQKWVQFASSQLYVPLTQDPVFYFGQECRHKTLQQVHWRLIEPTTKRSHSCPVWRCSVEWPYKELAAKIPAQELCDLINLATVWYKWWGLYLSRNQVAIPVTLVLLFFDNDEPHLPKHVMK